LASPVVREFLAKAFGGLIGKRPETKEAAV
jgi:hypothetical protein